MDPLIALQLIEPGLIIVLGAILLWFPRRIRREVQDRHAARLAQLEAGAEEAYFEERRELEAYKPFRKDRSWQLLGVFFVLGGAFQIFVLFNE